MGLTESAHIVVGNKSNTPSYSSSWQKTDEVKVKTVMMSSADHTDETDEDYANIIIDDSTTPSCMLPLCASFRHRSVDTKNMNLYFNERVSRPLKDTFLIACQSSYILLDPRNIIVLGQTGAGKSSTICHILGNRLPKHPTSTNLMEVPSGLYWQSRNSNKLRKVTPNNEVELFKQSILNSTGSADGSGAGVTHCDLVTQQERKLRSISNPQLETSSSDFKSYSSPFTEDLEKAVHKEIIAADLRGEPVPQSPHDTIPLYQFIDCGGMPFFRDLLPQFFPSAESNIFFIVHKLTDKLLHPAQIRVLKNGRLVHQIELPRMNMDEISDWIKIAHSCSAQSSLDLGDHIGNTFIVGTHFDHLQQQCFNDKALALEAAYIATDHICEGVVNNPCHTVLDPEPVFLSNTLSGTEGDPCPGVQKLRKKLWQYKPPNMKPVKLPVMWCIFIKRIREIANELNKPVISLDEFFEISKAYYLSRKEAEEVLKLCEKYCLIFHLDSAVSYLSKYLFINMQWLFSSLANILKQPDTVSKRGKYYSDWKDLLSSGLMTVNFHAHLFFHTPQVDCLPSTWASDLMEQLHLMSRVNLERAGARYFCPILLPLTISVDDDDDSVVDQRRDPFHYNEDTDSLHILPQNQYIPPGYLARLFTVISNISEEIQLVHCTNQKSATFKLLTDNSDESYFVRVSEDDKGGICLEFCSAFPNQVKFMRQRSIACKVLQIVVDASEQLKKVFKLAPCPILSINNGTQEFPTIFVKCLNKNCHHVHHLSRVFPQPCNKSKPFVECCSTQNRMFFSDLPPSQLIWLINLIEDKFEVSQFEQQMKKLEKEACSSVSCLVQTYPSCEHTSSSAANVASRIMLHRQQSRSRVTSLGGDDHFDLLQTRTWDATPRLRSPSSVLTCSSDQLREQFNFDYYFNVMEDYLDLDICNYLFQYGVLNNDERSRILSLNSPTKPSDLSCIPHCRASAISMLMEIVKAHQCHGFVGFITALEQTIDNTAELLTSTAHRAILDSLQKDKNFMKVKRNWLYSVTVW